MPPPGRPSALPSACGLCFKDAGSALLRLAPALDAAGVRVSLPCLAAATVEGGGAYRPALRDAACTDMTPLSSTGVGVAASSSAVAVARDVTRCSAAWTTREKGTGGLLRYSLCFLCRASRIRSEEPGAEASNDGSNPRSTAATRASIAGSNLPDISEPYQFLISVHKTARLEPQRCVSYLPELVPYPLSTL